MKAYFILVAAAAACDAAPSALSTTTQGLCESNSGCCPGSPILLNLNGDGLHLTAAADGVVFQLHPGRFGLWAWTQPASDDAFLALDVNGDGRIGDGAELFGDGSPQIASDTPNGFAALAYYDRADQGGNSDGRIDAADAVWPRLRLWRDTDHDAYSAPYELSTLDAAGVHSLSLDAVPTPITDLYGNETRFAAKIVADDPVSAVASDVWLVQAPLPEDPQELGGAPRDYTQWTCWAWAYALRHTGPDTPDGSQSVACDAPTTVNDPIATTYGGRLAKLVARYSVDRVKSTALSRASNKVFQSINVNWVDETSTVRGPCTTDAFPSPDLYYAPPYDQSTSIPDMIRVKCFSQVIHTGGGGGGGC